MQTIDSSPLEFDGVAGKIILFPTNAKTTGRGDESSSSPAAPYTGSRAVVRPLVKGKPSAEQGRVEASGLETLLNFTESARVLGVSLRPFRRLVDGGKIASVKISERSPRVRPSELQRFLAASVVKYSEVQS
jgi:hypothetical protein